MNHTTTTQTTPYKIGTRGSALALWQAKTVQAMLDVPCQLVIIKTSGDRFQDIPLQGQSQTGFFTKEIEHRLSQGDIDMAVHSLKDLPTASHPQLVLEAYLPRAAANDVLLIHPDWHDANALVPVKPGCKVGATSLRRQALLRLYGPQAQPTMLRGNVPTRIDKCRSGQYGAIVLAQAGVERLEIDTAPLVMYKLNPEIWLPAPGQGVVAVQARRSHSQLLPHIAALDDPLSRDAVTIERQLLAHFEGGCHTAFGAYALPDKTKRSNHWNVHVGLDMEAEKSGKDGKGGKGWGQVMLKSKNLESLLRITPAEIGGFTPLTVTKKENLCTLVK